MNSTLTYGNAMTDMTPSRANENIRTNVFIKVENLLLESFKEADTDAKRVPTLSMKKTPRCAFPVTPEKRNRSPDLDPLPRVPPPPPAANLTGQETNNGATNDELYRALIQATRMEFPTSEIRPSPAREGCEPDVTPVTPSTPCAMTIVTNHLEPPMPPKDRRLHYYCPSFSPTTRNLLSIPLLPDPENK